MKFIQFLGIGAAALLAASASASIIPTFTGASTSGGITTYTYDVDLDSQQNLITGNQLCFADVEGLTGTPTGPNANWTASNNMTSGCPMNAGATGTVPNVASSVLYTYIGSATIDGRPLESILVRLLSNPSIQLWAVITRLTERWRRRRAMAR